MEESIPSVDSIGAFTVTSREGETIMGYSDISEEDIKNLPEKANILEIGSGVFQEFSKKVKSIRDDVNVLSVDPTLAFVHQGDNTYKTPSGKLDFYASISQDPEILYYPKTDYARGLPEEVKAEAVEMHELRVRGASNNGGVAAIVPNLPFADKSIHLIVDCFGPGTWFCSNEEKTADYLKEITRLLVNDGVAVIFPIDTATEFWKNSDDDKARNDFAIERVGKVLGNLQAEHSFFQKEVKSRGNVNQRTGVRIEKK